MYKISAVLRPGDAPVTPGSVPWRDILSCLLSCPVLNMLTFSSIKCKVLFQPSCLLHFRGIHIDEGFFGFVFVSHQALSPVKVHNSSKRGWNHPSSLQTGFKMAAAFQKLRFAWSFRAVFAGREFVVNTLHQAKTKNKATTHIRKGVCLEWFFMFFLVFQGSNKLFIIHLYTMSTLVLPICYRSKLNSG